jgi:PPOX class probable F420-dependent enzyme
VELTPELVDALLERWPVARLATLRGDRRSHLVPVVFARSGGALWSPIDAKPKRAGELVRVRNVRARPQVALLLDHYDADWRRLWWLRVDGRAAVVEGRDPAADPELGAATAALRAKYPQYAEWPLWRAEPVLLRIALERVRSWCAGPEALEWAAERVARR